MREKANFPVKKRFWPIFSPIMECDKPQGIICKFLNKKANFPVIKIFGPIFSSIIEHDKRQGTTYKGTQGLLTRFVQATHSFP